MVAPMELWLYPRMESWITLQGAWCGMWTAIGEAVAAFFRYLGWPFMKLAGRWFKKKMTMGQMTKQSRQIDQLLAELRVSLRADRAIVAQFHNGGTFLNEMPQWKASVTNELLAPGVAPLQDGFQQVFSSRIQDIITPLFEPETVESKGCEKCESCPFSVCRVKLLEVFALRIGYARTLLENFGAQGVLICPLTGPQRKSDPTGFVMLTFNDLTEREPHDGNLPEDWAEEKRVQICAYAKRIEFLLNYPSE